MSDKAQIFNELQSYIVEQLGVEKEKVTPTAAFIEDLNADSLDLVEFAMGLEEKFGVTIADEEDRKSTRLNSSHSQQSRMPSSA